MPDEGATAGRTRVTVAEASLRRDSVYQRTVLDNGLRVLTSSMPHTRSVSISIYIGAGSRYETDAQAGVSHFLEHLLFKGTERRPSPQAISETLERVGGILNAATDRELTVYWAKVAKPHFSLALDLLVDMVRCSLFLPEEIERERRVILDEISMVNDSPPQRASVLLDALQWPDQPLGREIAGTRESIESLSREDLLAYLHTQYVPNNAVVSIAGAIEHDAAVEQVAALLGDWAPGTPSSWFPALEVRNGPRLTVEYRRTEQAHLCLGFPGLPIGHPDRYAQDLLNVVLGEGMSSRLFLELRERRALAYDVQSSIAHFLDTGSVGIYAGVQPGRARDALACMLEVVAGLQDEVPEDELEKARELTKGRLLLRMEDSRAVSGWLGSQELLSGRVRTVDEIVELLDGLTPKDLQRAARSLQPREACLAVVGPLRSPRRFAGLLNGMATR